MKSRLLVVLFALAVPVTGLAHPGHGSASGELVHYLVEAEHVLPLALLAAAGLFYGWIRFARGRAPRR